MDLVGAKHVLARALTVEGLRHEDELAVEIHNFLQIAIQIFEARYGEEIDRHYERQCDDYIAAASIDPPG